MRCFTCIVLFVVLYTAPAWANYAYAPSFCEFRITLPEPPRVATLWRNADPPFFITHLAAGIDAIGEESVYRRQDPEQSDFSIRTACIKTTPQTTAKIDKNETLTIADNYSHSYLPFLENKKRSYTPWGEFIKWGVVSGYSYSANKKQALHVVHVLVGRYSIMLIEGRMEGNNPDTTRVYEEILNSIDINFE